MKTENPTSYTVFVDDNFHYMDEDERYKLGEFATYEDAVVACEQIVDEYVLADLEPGMTARELYRRYISFGEDPWISNPGEHPHFSAWDYARARCKELCCE
jgi:hypothetical protein